MAKKKRPRTAPSGEGGNSNHTKINKASKLEAETDASPSLGWIAALASKASSSASNTGGGAGVASATTTTKEERIERRMMKNQRRQLKLDIINEEKTRGKLHAKDKSAAAHHGMRGAGLPAMKGGGSSKATARKGTNRTKSVDRERLERISSTLQERVAAIDDSFGNHKRPSRPYDSHEAVIKKAEASQFPASFRKRKWEESALQPRNRDYGGIGLARPTMYLELTDPSFVPKLEEEFHEHVPGFYGRSVFHNSQKRQASQNALWRTISDRAKTSGLKVDGKKLADMRPDERVEAMLRAGLI
jgi:hypothetical protein